VHATATFVAAAALAAPPCLASVDRALPPPGPRLADASWSTGPLAPLVRRLWPELPRGGRTILPRRRVVAYYGAPQATALGALGHATPAEIAALVRRARTYRRGGRPVLPALELIADLVKPFPTRDGSYRIRQRPRTICHYLAAARRARALLVLDLQPGRANVLADVRALRPWLEEPDVSLALDPEWTLAPDAVPNRYIGHMDARVIARVEAYLARLVARRRLPDKLLVAHEFTPTMIPGRDALRRVPGVELTIDVDGVGLPPDKLADWRLLAGPRDPWFHGLKLFYEEDGTVLTPAQVLALRPAPDLVIYE
jgi:hypothetical protein